MQAGMNITNLVKNAAGHFAAAACSVAGRRRLFVATWREGRNWGDDYLGQALVRYLRSEPLDFKLVETNLHLDWHQLNHGDILVVGGGGLWGPSGTGRLDDRLFSVWMGTKANLVIANIGIESFSQSSVPQLEALADKSRFLSFRDEESYTLAYKHIGDRSQWCADNTYLSPLKIAREPVSRCIAVNLCGPEQENNSRNYSTAAIIENIKRLPTFGYSLRGIVFSYMKSLSDFPHCVQVDQSCHRTFSADPLRTCELFIGMHFHSCALSLQNEIPTVAISYSDKVRRLFAEYKMEEFCLDPTRDDMTIIPTLVALAYQNRDLLTARIRDGNARAQGRLILFRKKMREMLAS
jgi:polysaccharide pyruvyl transferase WcaK-like protein